MHDMWRGVMVAPGRILAATVLQAVVNMGYPLALLLTTSARALMLISLNPLWAALLGRVLLKERLAPPTLLLLITSMCAVALVFAPNIFLGDEEGGIAGAAVVVVAVVVTTTANYGHYYGHYYGKLRPLLPPLLRQTTVTTTATTTANKRPL